ncbi:flagellar FliJ family protein [Nocardioides sp. Arc9.136]|uniref:flagellar FliJ family protein n=1 Tax=Nocardioides sp. Arc9.136 TaxID=2996826 RepID=UPI00266683C3|nr:flagellar FliJ family protein [Nocardioides sp. Arc9.136]WKN47612.1 flagellar FliJ family protein [Nocardioides sp. Arc9.136]
MSARERDRGLRAVARVREVRERDSRLGLQRALQEQQEHALALSALEVELASRVEDPGTADAAAYVARRAALQSLGAAVGGARGRLDSAEVVRAAADAHWRSDHTRLSAVEGLLEGRADVRRAEALHEEAKELDDAAGRQWLRRAVATRRAEEGR